MIIVLDLYSSIDVDFEVGLEFVYLFQKIFVG